MTMSVYSTVRASQLQRLLSPWGGNKGPGCNQSPSAGDGWFRTTLVCVQVSFSKKVKEIVKHDFVESADLRIKETRFKSLPSH